MTVTNPSHSTASNECNLSSGDPPLKDENNNKADVYVNGIEKINDDDCYNGSVEGNRYEDASTRDDIIPGNNNSRNIIDETQTTNLQHNSSDFDLDLTILNLNLNLDASINNNGLGVVTNHNIASRASHSSNNSQKLLSGEQLEADEIPPDDEQGEQSDVYYYYDSDGFEICLDFKSKPTEKSNGVGDCFSRKTKWWKNKSNRCRRPPLALSHSNFEIY